MSLNINDVFDANFYRAAHPSLAGLNDAQALSNFQTSGLNQGLSFSPLIDLNFYRASNSDLANLSNNQLLQHFEIHGIDEGRKSSPSFNTSSYKASNPNLASLKGIQLLEYSSPYINFAGSKVYAENISLAAKSALRNLDGKGINITYLAFAPNGCP